MKKKYALLFSMILSAQLSGLVAQSPRIHWDFESFSDRKTKEAVSGQQDTLEGYYLVNKGVNGTGLALDGFTACLKSTGTYQVKGLKEFTVEAWIALGEYPWNWCPILTTESNEVKGYRLMVGPLGQAALECGIGEQWIACTSGRDAIPLRQWTHIIGVYRENTDLCLYVNGELRSSISINGSFTPTQSDFILGMVASPAKPSDIHRTWGTIPQFFGLDGILDEVKVYDKALSADQARAAFTALNPGVPAIEERKLPKIANHPRKFGAFYTKLQYYPGWDNLWPVDQDPDIVVCFDRSPVKLIFWRGIRYGASWVSENENWMTDQSVEAWEHGDADREGCFEHMQDRHCRFSHVRIVENNDARVVVHWRYAPVSAYDNTWRPDPKTGWECWVDEYYFVYPDGTAIRKVSWKKGTLGFPRQFQETLALLHPGQKVSDLLEIDFATTADYEGNLSKVSFVENPNVAPYGPFDWSQKFPFTIQQYNFKSDNKPFICFEPGNEMFIRYERLDGYDLAKGCNHFPVGQARCDGRTTRTSDKPSHCSSFPISDPVVHETADREYWNGLYGMNTMEIGELIRFGRSWAYPPSLTLRGNHYQSDGYDKSERCYQLKNTSGKPGSLEITLEATENSPAVNPAIFISNWNSKSAKVLVNGKPLKDCRIGINQELHGTDLVVFIGIDTDKTIKVRILP
ncbi:MAG: LamG domain-containing protein [Bacteroidales bacterium]